MFETLLQWDLKGDLIWHGENNVADWHVSDTVVKTFPKENMFDHDLTTMWHSENFTVRHENFDGVTINFKV